MEHWPTLEFLKLLLALILFFAGGYMLYRYQTIRKEKRLNIFHAEKIDRMSDIRALLDTILQQRVRLMVRLNERRRSYSSSLVAIGPSHLLIDALFPAEGNELIGDAGFIIVDFILRGTQANRLYAPYSFRSTFMHPEEYSGFPALRIGFPESITRNQKRNYLRISPPVNEPLFFECVLAGKKLKEKIINLSGGGVSFYTNHGKSVFLPGRILKEITIGLPGNVAIECSFIVRKLSQNEQPVFIDGTQIFNYCGGEFTDIQETTRDKIIKYVVEQERLALKRLSREF